MQKVGPDQAGHLELPRARRKGKFYPDRLQDLKESPFPCPGTREDRSLALQVEWTLMSTRGRCQPLRTAEGPKRFWGR